MKREVRQKAIGFKIDIELLEELDKECYVSARKRNTMINLAIGYYLKYVDCCRILKSVGTRQDREIVFNNFKQDQFCNLLDF